MPPLMRSMPTNVAVPSAAEDISHSVVDVPAMPPAYDLVTMARVRRRAVPGDGRRLGLADQEVGELPGIVRIDERSLVGEVGEQVTPAGHRIPVGRSAVHRAEVVAG